MHLLGRHKVIKAVNPDVESLGFRADRNSGALIRVQVIPLWAHKQLDTSSCSTITVFPPGRVCATTLAWRRERKMRWRWRWSAERVEGRDGPGGEALGGAAEGNRCPSCADVLGEEDNFKGLLTPLDRLRNILAMKYSKGDILVPKAKHFPDGAIIVDGYDSKGLLMAHLLQGEAGLRLSALSASVFRLVDEGELAGALFRRGRFALAESKEVFSGWTDGRTWNGWQMPRFEKVEAERLVRWLGDGRWRFDASRDVLVTLSQAGKEECWRAGTIVVSDGSAVRVYGVGAGAWMWGEVKNG